MDRVPLSPTMAWLAELRPDDVDQDAPMLPSTIGTPLNSSNMYNRVLRPALIKAGIARNLGTEDSDQAQ